MIWLINNKPRKHSDSKYIIDWNSPAPSKLSQSVKDFLLVNCSGYQWFEEYRLPSCLLRVDFLCPAKKLAIECDGRQHTNYVGFFHGNRLGYLNSIIRDDKKEKILLSNGFKIVRITDSDLPLSRGFFENYGVFL